ncbi:hypothetical protein FQN57_003616 [Myotisia sp. PD_48]|nr:hypothetical protein FQN57_003616 [Myotisia sp. PD_48]
MAGPAKHPLFLAVFLLWLLCTTSLNALAIPHRTPDLDLDSDPGSDLADVPVKVHQSDDNVAIQFEASCKQCFGDLLPSTITFDLTISRTNNVCGENNIKLNDQKLDFAWDGINAYGESIITTQSADGQQNVELALFWRALCIASPKDSVEDYAAQILTVTYYPTGHDIEDEPSGFAVSFNSVDKPAILRLSTSPVMISEDTDTSSMGEWLGLNDMHVQSAPSETPLNYADLEKELAELNVLKQQALFIEHMIQQKDQLIREHLTRDCARLTQKLKECKNLKCFIKTSFKIVPDVFRLMKYRFGPLPNSISSGRCRSSSSKAGNSTEDIETDDPLMSDNNKLPTYHSNTTAPGFSLIPNGLPSIPAFTPPQMHPHSGLGYMIRDLAALSFAFVLVCFALRRCGNTLSCRRRRVDMLARREERRTRQAYQAAACRYRIQRVWRRILHPSEIPTPMDSLHNQTNPHDPTSDSNAAGLQPPNNAIPNEILGLRRVLEYVGELVRPTEEETSGQIRRRIVQPDTVEISTSRGVFTIAPTAPSSTAPLTTTIGSPRTSISMLSYETTSLDTIDSLDAETETIMSS